MLARRSVHAVCATVFVVSASFAAMERASALTSDEAAKAEAKALAAKFKFKAGKHEEAAALFLEAYALSRKPALLYNAARAFEEAGKQREAKAAFEQYLGLPDVSAAGRRDARLHVADLEKKLATARAPAEPSAAEPSPAEPSPAERVPAKPSVAERSAANRAAAKKALSERAPVKKATGAAGLSRSAVGAGLGGGSVHRGREPSRNKWVTYGIAGGATLMLLAGIGGQLRAVRTMDEANAMSFAVDNQFDPAQVKAKKKAYRDKLAAAEEQQGSAVISVAIGVGLGAWAAYRLLSSDPGLAASKPGAVSWRAAPALLRSGESAVGALVVWGTWP